MKYNKTQIKKFAKECAKINTEMWNLICNCEELLSNPVAKELRNNLAEDNKNLLLQIHNCFMEVTDDEESIDTDLHSATLSDVSYLISMIIEDGTEGSKNCLSCSNSFSEPSDNDEGDILHCMLNDGKIVEENSVCKEWN
jgi:hypothetical protein